MEYFVSCYFTHTFVYIFRHQQISWTHHVLLMAAKNNQLQY